MRWRFQPERCTVWALPLAGCRAAECLRRWFDRRGCAIGCAALSPSALAERAGPIRLAGSTFSQRHAPHPRRPQQPAGGPGGPLGRPAAADPAAVQAAGTADPPPARATALNGPGSNRWTGPHSTPLSCWRSDETDPSGGGPQAEEARSKPSSRNRSIRCKPSCNGGANLDGIRPSGAERRWESRSSSVTNRPRP